MNFKTFKKGVVFGVAVLAIFALSVPAVFAQPVPGGTLDPTTVPKYVTPLVIPPVMNDTGTTNDYDIAVRQFQQQILPGGIWTGGGGLPATTVWSYGPAADPLPDSSGITGGAVGVAPAMNSQFNYPSFTIETISNPTNNSANYITVDWINDLKENFGAGPKYLPHLLAIDQTLHWANPGADCISGAVQTDCRGSSGQPYTGPVPIVTHVHGAHADPQSDGYPEAWWLPDPTGSNFSCVTDPAQAVGSKYVCEGSIANRYGVAANTNVIGRLGVGQYVYRNDQPSTTLWYHDHALGMTRNNVYAGPAGFWLIRNPSAPNSSEDGLVSGTLPGPAPVAGDDPNFDAGTRAAIREVPIVIQDRSFNADGSLFYPDNRAFFEGVTPNMLNINYIPQSDISPIWNPEFFGNHIVVNGTTWPYYDVEPDRYRFRLLNGSNSRFLNLSLRVVNPDQTLGAEIPFYQIGAEQSLLPNVVKVQRGMQTTICQNTTDPCVTTGVNVVTVFSDGQQALLIGLAERADVIVDFSSLTPGTHVRMINTAPDAPFGGFPDIPADPGTTGQVMEFVVVEDTAAGNGSTAPENLILSLVDSGDATTPSSTTRDLALLEEESAEVCARIRPNGRIMQIRSVKPGPNFAVDCLAAGGFAFAPKAAVLGINGSTTPAVTLWSDPIATNPVSGATETWELWNYTADGHPIHLHLVKFQVQDREMIGGATRPPEATEAGWKDTVIAYPGETTRLKAKFDIEGLYVWHCHIVEHEDNEMMVPYCVGSKTANGCQNLTFQ